MGTIHTLVSLEKDQDTQVCVSHCDLNWFYFLTPYKCFRCGNILQNPIIPVAAEEGISGVLVSEKCDDRVGHYDGINDEFTTERLKCLDGEGRSVITKFSLGEGSLVVINVYCPRADPERLEERETFKLEFYKLLELRALALIRAGHKVVILVM